MLDELVVTNLGVIERGEIVLSDAMTALTGETGAGKTLVVEAISLLLGDRSDAGLIRVGAREARVDGRFRRGDTELVLSRVIPRNGRSRAYIDGHPVPVSQLQELGATLVDLHGQHGHQSLLASSAQREALDAFGGLDLTEFRRLRLLRRDLDAERTRLGGDVRARERELDMLRFQLEEIGRTAIVDVHEDQRLREEEETLSDAVALREVAESARAALDGESGASEAVGAALRALTDRSAFAEVAQRLRALSVEIRDVAGDLRSIGDQIEPNDERLHAIRLRRGALRDLQRKYGESLEAVLAFATEHSSRLQELIDQDARAATIDAEIRAADKEIESVFARIVSDRRVAGTSLARAIEQRLHSLAMPSARVTIDVDHTLSPNGEGHVTFLLAANPGSEAAPLSKVASGGELARIMLALRLALLEGRELVSGEPPDTLLFDEVDAGIGGTAAVAVGRALADLARGRQVLVVTHLAQVAACATNHVRVAKTISAKHTSTTVAVLEHDERIGELARMLAGSDSAAARVHATELLLESNDSARIAKGSASKAVKPSKPKKTAKAGTVSEYANAGPKKVEPVAKTAPAKNRSRST